MRTWGGVARTISCGGFRKQVGRGFLETPPRSGWKFRHVNQPGVVETPGSEGGELTMAAKKKAAKKKVAKKKVAKKPAAKKVAKTKVAKKPAAKKKVAKKAKAKK